MPELDATLAAGQSGDAQEAYAYGVGAYNSYSRAKAEGKSDAEAIGEIGGALGAAAACTATGAGVAVAGLCGAAGGIIGGIIGKALGGLFASEPDYANDICKGVTAELLKVGDAARKDGLDVSDAELRAWFTDAATRAKLPTGWSLHGEIGREGAWVDGGSRRVSLLTNGMPVFSEAELSRPLGAGIVTEYQFATTWQPVGRCIWPALKVHNPSQGVKRAAFVGLAAVAARIDALRNRRAARNTLLVAAGGGLLGGAIWWWRRRRKRRRTNA